MEADGGASYEEPVVLLGELIGCVYHDVTPVWKHAHSKIIHCMGLLVAGIINQIYLLKHSMDAQALSWQHSMSVSDSQDLGVSFKYVPVMGGRVFVSTSCR